MVTLGSGSERRDGPRTSLLVTSACDTSGIVPSITDKSRSLGAADLVLSNAILLFLKETKKCFVVIV